MAINKVSEIRIVVPVEGTPILEFDYDGGIAFVPASSVRLQQSKAEVAGLEKVEADKEKAEAKAVADAEKAEREARLRAEAEAEKKAKSKK